MDTQNKNKNLVQTNSECWRQNSIWKQISLQIFFNRSRKKGERIHIDVKCVHCAKALTLIALLLVWFDSWMDGNRTFGMT